MSTPIPSWNKLLIRAGLSSFSDQLRPRAQPCFRIADFLPERKHVIGRSRIGGFPDCPPDFIWPMDGDRYLSFLAQINLSELHPGFIPEIPSEGWLYFFLGVNESACNVNHRVLYFAGHAENLAKRRPPPNAQPIGDDRIFNPFGVAWEAGYSVSADDAVWKEIDESPCRGSFGVLYSESTQIGGHALSFAGNPSEEAYLCKNGFEAILSCNHMTVEELERAIEGNRSLGQSWLVKSLERVPRDMLADYQRSVTVHQRKMAEWRPLLILGSCGDMCWWDVGFLQFMINERDLAKSDFSNTYCCVTST